MNRKKTPTRPELSNDPNSLALARTLPANVQAEQMLLDAILNLRISILIIC